MMAFRNKEQSRTSSYHDDFSDCNSYKHRSVVSTKSESSLRRKNVVDFHKGKDSKFHYSGHPGGYSREREMENRRNQSCCCNKPQNKYKRKPEDNQPKSDCKCLDCRIKNEKVTKTGKSLDNMDKGPKNYNRNISKDPRKRVSKQSDDMKKLNRSDKHVNYGHKCTTSGKSGTRSHSCTSSCIDEKYYEKMRQKMWNDMMPEMERYVNKKMRAQNKHKLQRESRHKENMKSDLYSKISKNYSKLSEVTENLKKCVDKGFLSLFKWADDISDRYSNRGLTTSDAGSVQSKVSDFDYTSCDNTSDEVLSATSSRLVTNEDPCNDDEVFIYETCEDDKRRNEQGFETTEELPTSPSSIVSQYSIPLVNISHRNKCKTKKYEFQVIAPSYVEDTKVMRDLSESLNADNSMAAFLQHELEQSSLDSFTNNNFKGTMSMPIALSGEESKGRPYLHAVIDDHDIFDEKYDQSNFLSIGRNSNPSHKSLRSESKFEIVESIRIDKDCDSTSSVTELASLLGDSEEMTKAGTNLDESNSNFTSNFIKRDEYLNSYASIRKDVQETTSTMDFNEHLLHEDHVLNHSDEFLLVTRQETGAISKIHPEISANYRLSPDSGNASAFSSEIEPKTRTNSDSDTISTTWIGSDSIQRSGRLLRVNNDSLSGLTGAPKPSLFFSNHDSGTCSSDEELHILAINRIENHQESQLRRWLKYPQQLVISQQLSSEHQEAVDISRKVEDFSRDEMDLLCITDYSVTTKPSEYSTEDYKKSSTLTMCYINLTDDLITYHSQKFISFVNCYIKVIGKTSEEPLTPHENIVLKLVDFNAIKERLSILLKLINERKRAVDIHSILQEASHNSSSTYENSKYIKQLVSELLDNMNPA